MTEKLLRPFREQRIPVTGFVNEAAQSISAPEGLREVLDMWLDAGRRARQPLALAFEA